MTDLGAAERPTRRERRRISSARRWDGPRCWRSRGAPRRAKSRRRSGGSGSGRRSVDGGTSGAAAAARKRQERSFPSEFVTSRRSFPLTVTGRAWAWRSVERAIAVPPTATIVGRTVGHQSRRPRGSSADPPLPGILPSSPRQWTFYCPPWRAPIPAITTLIVMVVWQCFGRCNPPFWGSWKKASCVKKGWEVRQWGWRAGGWIWRVWEREGRMRS
mmetsp:Transcript_47850/g.144733  ORF Transcript_47850/g.144733 Transcript_47850/m.144733 type:complete len:216 (+) Transcript_47850:225-872(+)